MEALTNDEAHGPLRNMLEDPPVYPPPYPPPARVPTVNVTDDEPLGGLLLCIVKPEMVCLSLSISVETSCAHICMHVCVCACVCVASAFCKHPDAAFSCFSV